MIQTLASFESSTFVNVYIILWEMHCNMFQYHHRPRTSYGFWEMPPLLRQGRRVKLWVLGDASFAPTGAKSQQGPIAYHGITSNQKRGGNLLQWRSHRQDLIAKFTCEAERIASSEALQQGKNIAIVVTEMTNKSVRLKSRVTMQPHYTS